jgi:putative transposase
MPRLPRLFLPGQAHHVIQRGNNRQAVFFHEVDRELFLVYLSDGLVAENCALHVYVLMTNHVHLLVSADKAEAIPRLMQSPGRRYVRHVNSAYRRTGTLWEGRYKSTILDSETYVLACHRYAEANPVRAGIVVRAGDYPWSSYPAHAMGDHDPMLTDHPTYLALGPTPKDRQEAYRALFDQGLDPEIVETLRDATNRGWVPGRDRFQREIAAALGRRVTAPRRGRPPKARAIAEDTAPATLV